MNNVKKQINTKSKVTSIRPFVLSAVVALGIATSASPVLASTIVTSFADAAALNAQISSTDLFQGATVVTTSNLASFSNANDLFGAALSPTEPGRVFAVDGYPIKLSISFSTASLVTIGGFNLFLAQDSAGGARSVETFSLLNSRSEVVKSGTLLPGPFVAAPVPNYASQYGTNLIGVYVTLDALATDSSWTIELTNNSGAGLRAYELDAVVIPEPSTWSMLAVGLTTIIALRRRNP
jgi:hypothetical protein